MATDDPNEKSLFTRIKDCVLMELRRSRSEMKRAQCPSRSTWAWKIDENGTSAENSELEKRERDKLKEKTSPKENGDIENKEGDDEDVSRGGRSAGGQEHVKKRIGKQSSDFDGKEYKEKHHGDAEKEFEKHEKSHTRENDKKTEITRIDLEKEKSEDQRESCGSNKFKPVRYYIKMQNPEAPVCCETLGPRKICPPKTRKQQADDANRISKPTCRCRACLSDSDENHS